MPGKCDALGCSKYAVYGIIGARPQRCNGHKDPEMVDVKNPICKFVDCRRRPSYNFDGRRAIYCNRHKAPGMLNVVSRRCEEPGCMKQPMSSRNEIKFRYCRTHFEERGMSFVTERNQDKYRDCGDSTDSTVRDSHRFSEFCRDRDPSYPNNSDQLSQFKNLMPNESSLLMDRYSQNHYEWNIQNRNNVKERQQDTNVHSMPMYNSYDVHRNSLTRSPICGTILPHQSQEILPNMHSGINSSTSESAEQLALQHYEQYESRKAMERSEKYQSKQNIQYRIEPGSEWSNFTLDQFNRQNFSHGLNARVPLVTPTHSELVPTDYQHRRNLEMHYQRNVHDSQGLIPQFWCSSTQQGYIPSSENLSRQNVEDNRHCTSSRVSNEGGISASREYISNGKLICSPAPASTTYSHQFHGNHIFSDGSYPDGPVFESHNVPNPSIRGIKTESPSMVFINNTDSIYRSNMQLSKKQLW